MVWPAGLVPFYPHARGGLSHAAVGHAALLLAAVTAVVVWARRRRYLTVGWLWYLGTLVPVIGLVQVGAQAMADRYTYIPLIGLFIAAVWAVGDLTARWPRQVRVPVAVAALLLGTWGPLVLWQRGSQEMLADRTVWIPLGALSALAVLALGVGAFTGLWRKRVPAPAAAFGLVLGLCLAFTFWQVRLWHNSTWLWEYTVQATKDNWLAHDNLGVAYLSVNRWDEAAEHFRAALAASEQRDGKAWHNLGLVAMNQGDLENAVRCYARAAELEPGLAVVPDNWGVALTRLGRAAEAVPLHERALALDPDSPRVLNNLGMALAWAGRWDEALAAFRRAAEIDPRTPAYRGNLGWALEHTGHKEDAAEAYAAIVRVDDKWPETTRQSAWGLATSPQERRRNPYEAVRLAEQACQAAGGGAEYVDTLAAAYAEAGRFDEAAAWAGWALCLAADNPDRARAIAARLEDFKAGHPFRDKVTR
jgi:tetratricopeptide (TPR) repeat protein